MAKAGTGTQSRDGEGRNRAPRVVMAKAGTGTQSRFPSPKPSSPTDSVGVPGRPPPRSESVHMPGLVHREFAHHGRDTARTLRCMKYRLSTRLRTPLIDFDGVIAKDCPEPTNRQDRYSPPMRRIVPPPSSTSTPRPPTRNVARASLRRPDQRSLSSYRQRGHQQSEES
jgi:hypothetical protein